MYWIPLIVDGVNSLSIISVASFIDFWTELVNKSMLLSPALNTAFLSTALYAVVTFFDDASNCFWTALMTLWPAVSKSSLAISPLLNLFNKVFADV